MPLVTFISFDGSEQEVHVASGTTLMHAATDNGVAGILADCGGACSCATCHCYVDDAWLEQDGSSERRGNANAGVCYRSPAQQSPQLPDRRQ